jgi:hypothetical protein
MTDTALSTFLASKRTEIAREHDAAMKSANEALTHAVKAGQLLIEAKAQVQHGEWESWFTDNLSFSLRTAQKYMQLAGHERRLQEIREGSPALTIDESLKMLADEKMSPMDKMFKQATALLEVRAANNWSADDAEWDAYCRANVGGPAEDVNNIIDMLMGVAKSV